MSILKPLTDEIFNVPGLTKEQKEKFQEYNNDYNEINANMDGFNYALLAGQNLTTFGNMMLVAVVHLTMGAEDYGQWKAANPRITDLKKIQAPEIEEIAAFADDLFGGYLALQVGKNLVTKGLESAPDLASRAGGALKTAFGDAAKAVTDLFEGSDVAIEEVAQEAGEAGAELGIDTASEVVAEGVADGTIEVAEVGVDGIGIFGLALAVVIDGIISGMESKSEEAGLKANIKKIEDGIDKLKSLLDKLSTETGQAETALVESMKGLQKTMIVLDYIKPAEFEAKDIATLPIPQFGMSADGYLTITDDNKKLIDQWVVAAKSASAQYGFLQKVRDSYHDFQQNKKSSVFTKKEDFVSWFNNEAGSLLQLTFEHDTSDRKPASQTLDDRQVFELMQYVCENSGDKSMAEAWEANKEALDQELTGS